MHLRPRPTDRAGERGLLISPGQPAPERRHMFEIDRDVAPTPVTTGRVRLVGVELGAAGLRRDVQNGRAMQRPDIELHVGAGDPDGVAGAVVVALTDLGHRAVRPAVPVRLIRLPGEHLRPARARRRVVTAEGSRGVQLRGEGAIRLGEHLLQRRRFRQQLHPVPGGARRGHRPGFLGRRPRRPSPGSRRLAAPPGAGRCGQHQPEAQPDPQNAPRDAPSPRVKRIEAQNA
jgi:hypothetical protein